MKLELEIWITAVVVILSFSFFYDDERQNDQSRLLIAI